ncbi:hypothetical protein Tco_0546512 [Tanacetum coccineum]
MDEEETVPVTLGRLFIATTRAVIDLHDGKLSLRVRNEVFTFILGKSVCAACSLNDYLYFADHTTNLVKEQWVDNLIHDGKWTDIEDEIDSEKVQAISFYPRREPIEPLEWRALKNRLNPSIKKPPKLELKELLDHLEYGFLQEDDQLPVVISSSFSTHENAKLVEVLKNHNGAIAWSIANIKGIDPSFCTHKILMEDEYKPTVQPQRCVNPNIKEVVKKEVVKLLNACLIYQFLIALGLILFKLFPKKGDDRGK